MIGWFLGSGPPQKNGSAMVGTKMPPLPPSVAADAATPAPERGEWAWHGTAES